MRCGRSCRLKWMNNLGGDLKRGNFSEDEDEAIVKLQWTLGNKWSLIASLLPGRTDNEIKNYRRTHLRRRMHRFRSIDMSDLPSAEAIKKNRKLARKCTDKGQESSAFLGSPERGRGSADEAAADMVVKDGQEFLADDHSEETDCGMAGNLDSVSEGMYACCSSSPNFSCFDEQELDW